MGVVATGFVENYYMLNIIKTLFGHKETASDGLQQLQREGLIELLLIAMYADNKLTLNEDEMIKRQAESFCWDSGIYIDGFIEQATARVRDVHSISEKRLAFFQQIAEKLEDVETRQQAYNLCLQLFLSDGEQSVEETTFAGEIKSAFGL